MHTCHAHTAKRRFITTFVTPLLFALACPSVAHAQCQYEVTAIIQGPHCGFGFFAPLVGRGMNSHGHVAGSYFQCSVSADEAFYWTPDTGLITLPRSEDIFSAVATDINDSGLVVGRHLIIGDGWTGFVYNPRTRAFSYLPPLHDGHGQMQTVSTINAINNDGIAVGSRVISKPGVVPAVSNAVIWDTNTGEVIDLGVMNGPNSGALGISDSAEFVVGWFGSSTPVTIGFCRRGDDVVMISPFDGADTSTPSDVAENGDVVGTGIILDASVSRAYLWRDGVHLAIIDPAPGFTSTQGVGINNVGQVLYRNSSSASNIVPALWQNGNGRLVSELVLDLSDITLQQPRGINDAGQILTRGLNQGHNVAVLLSPVNQPTGDLNIDCRVDVHDLLILLDAWGPVPRAKRQAGSPADLNGDGVVDVSDLLILLHHWTF